MIRDRHDVVLQPAFVERHRIPRSPTKATIKLDGRQKCTSAPQTLSATGVERHAESYLANFRNLIANLGPLPSSSCLKNTNASRQSCSQLLHPFLQRRVVVLGPTQTQTTPVGGRHEGNGKVILFVGDAQCGVMITQQFEDFVVEPRRMPKFKRHTPPAWQHARNARSRNASFLKLGGNWNSSGPRRFLNLPATSRNRTTRRQRP